MEFNRVFVPLNNFFSTFNLEPLVRNWDWARSSNHIHRVPRKTVYYGRSPSVVVCCVEVGWLSGRLASINRGTSVVANCAGLFLCKLPIDKCAQMC